MTVPLHVLIDPSIVHDAVPRIADLGRLAQPREAVGLLFPDGHILLLANEDQGTGSYKVSRRQLKKAFKGLKGKWGLDDAIIWHTHPGGLVGPSRGDLKQRRMPILNELSHLVVTLPNGEATFY